MTMQPSTIGFISTWPVYQGTTIDRYAHSLIQGICAGASDLGCRLLLGCGFSVTGFRRQNSVWPVPGADVNFVPVGPWNTDGLIIVPDELIPEQYQYVQDLIQAGFPIIFTTPEGPGSVVTVDNTLGIHQAFEHLLQHGHRSIAFIAGNSGNLGDSGERLRAYLTELKSNDLPEIPELIAYGEHNKDGGALAMQKILASNIPFSAVIASNDLSCLGAIHTLKQAGKRIPDDVAVIGFDDILDARALSPSLSTIRHPTFTLGYRAVQTLKEIIQGERSGFSRVVVPPKLIIRQSCGCRPVQWTEPSGLIPTALKDLAHGMTENAYIEARTSSYKELEEQNLKFLHTLVSCVQNQDGELFSEEIDRLIDWMADQGEDARVWQASTAVLIQNSKALLSLLPEIDPGYALGLVNKARSEIDDQVERQTTRSLLNHMDMMAQLGHLTAEMLSADNVDASAGILSRWLPQIGIKNALVCLFLDDEEGQLLNSTVLFGSGTLMPFKGVQFESRKFPLPEVYPLDQAFQLTIVPLKVDEKMKGFVAFEAPNPELCAAVVHNLSAALRMSHLYQDAIEGRRLAEEANRLKSRFLSMVSHELRTPLSLIVGLSEMAMHSDPVVLKDIEQINNSAQHLSRLIGDVLDLASSEAGQLRILREPVDLCDTIQVTSKLGKQLAEGKGLAWEVRLPAERIFVLGDKTRLRQVVLNLICNAVKFTTFGKVQLVITRKDDHAWIAINDTGIGIPDGEIQTVFNEFFRTERAREFGIGGMGLGLAVTRQLVEQHSGTIEVFSPGYLGIGSTFLIKLPCFTSPKPDGLLEFEPTPENNQVILLAEREDLTDDLQRYLESKGYQIVTCIKDDCPDWVARVEARPPVAIILGEHLAISEGWAIAEILKKKEITTSIPVMAYSLDREKNQGELLELNYLYKPLNQDIFSTGIPALTRISRDATILVVDDDPGILEMHCRMIQKAGRKTLAARNGKEALGVLEHSHPDLILLDLMMPIMDGFEFLDRMRSMKSICDIPVVILTARILSEADLEKCNRGVASILGKGLFSAEETLSHIEAALTRQNQLGNATRMLVRKAMAVIHSRYEESLSREDIADQVGISPDYLTECFRQELGVTPITYIRRYRIRQACDLLKSTDLSITQVAMQVGYSDCAHFTRTFIREMGISPKVFRRR